MIPEVAELVGRAQRQDAEAFAQLIQRYERAALAVAYARVRHPDRAGDAVQEAFLRAWQELPRLHDPRRFGGWLMQIVRNAAIDLRRRVKPTAPEAPDVPADGPDPADAAAADDDAAQVRTALAALDETTRSAVMLRYYDGLSTLQIADLLELSPAAVDMRLSRARGQLREQLAGLLDDRSPDRSVPAPPQRRRVLGELS